MSSKVALSWQERTENTPGFHVYEDVLDTFGDEDAIAPVYLTLDGVELEMFTSNGKACVTITLPRDTAIKLGLVKD